MIQFSYCRVKGGVSLRIATGKRLNRRNRLYISLAPILAVIIVLAAVQFVGSMDEEFYDSIPVVEAPDWVEKKILKLNPYSRPGDPLVEVNNIVIHYVGNPGTTAKQNHSFFEGIGVTGETSASSHFVVGIEGEIIQCVPLNEIAYCSNHRNFDTIAIETCHPDDTGEFTEATKESLKQLVLWLCDVYDLGKEDIIRHYDVTGKECPRYYVRNPEEWDALLDYFFKERDLLEEEAFRLEYAKRFPNAVK